MKIVKWVVLVVVAGVCIGTIATMVGKQHEKEQAQAQTQQLATQAGSGGGSSAMTVAPATLCSDFQANQIAAGRRYGGVNLDVAGVIDGFNQALTGEPWVRLDGNSPPGGLPCKVNLEFPKAREGQVVDAKVGDSFRAVCQFEGGPAGFLMGDVMLGNCARVQSGTADAPPCASTCSAMVKCSKDAALKEAGADEKKIEEEAVAALKQCNERCGMEPARVQQATRTCVGVGDCAALEACIRAARASGGATSRR